VNDAEYEAQQKRIEECVRKWLAALGLLHWDWALEFHRDGLPTYKDDADQGYSRAAEVAVRWQYEHFRLSVNVPHLAEVSDKDLDKIIVHECMHVFLHELRNVTDDWLKHEEHAASALTKALLWAREDAIKSAPEGVPYGDSS
jgi:hypothetical protein